LMCVSGYALREEPCTDPYARFCGQTGAAAPSDPMDYVTVGATPKAGEKTSEMVHDLTEIA
jgi:hypothetical protein